MPRSINWQQLAAEFFVIVIGVLVSLGVDDWRQSRDDRVTEQYILSGILADLSRDRDDIQSAINAAMGRASAADKILSVMESSASGTVEMTPWISGSFNRQQAFENALEKYPADSLSVGLAYRMLMSTASMQRLNVSSATYSGRFVGEESTV